MPALTGILNHLTMSGETTAAMIITIGLQAWGVARLKITLLHSLLAEPCDVNMGICTLLTGEEFAHYQPFNEHTHTHVGFRRASGGIEI